MDKIDQFEDIIAWQKARTLTREIYACSKSGAFAKDFGLRDQIQRASVSTMANIAEGFERGGDREFIQFLSDSKASCGEVRSHLYVALGQGYISSSRFEELSAEAVEVSRLVSVLCRICVKATCVAENTATYDFGLWTLDIGLCT